MFTNDDPLFKGLSHDLAKAAGISDFRYREPAKEHRLVMEAAEAVRQDAIEEEAIRLATIDAEIDMEVDATYEDIAKKTKAVYYDVFGSSGSSDEDLEIFSDCTDF